MYEKILQKLKTQRGTTSNVSDRSLEDLAKTLTAFILNDQALESADFSAAIASIDGNINRYTADQVKKHKEAEEAAKKKAQEDADKKAKEEAAKKAAEEAAKSGIPTNEPPEWAKLIIEGIAKVNGDIAGIKTEKAQVSRAEILKKSLENLPDYFTKPILNGFERLKFESDEDFVSYKSEVEKQRDDFVQAMKENGLNTFQPKKEVEVPANDKELNPIFKKAFESYDVSQKQKEQ